MNNLLQRLMTLAWEALDCADFLARARELAPPRQLDDLFRTEFMGPESFFEWAREQAPRPALELHPLVRLLRLQCQDLASELGNLVLQHDTLVHGTIPTLEADYLNKVGGTRVHLLEIQVENQRLKRFIEAVQACRNRGQEPHLELIEQRLELELRSWTQKVEQHRREVQLARQAMSRLLEPGQVQKIRALYRELVKLLHPDLNPPTSERARLWLQVQDAYQGKDVQGLRILVGLARRLGDAAPWDQTSALDQLRQQRDHLQAQVQTLAERLQQLKNSFPYNHRDKLEDPNWVEEQNRHAAEQAEQELRIRAALEARLRALTEDKDG